MPKPRLGEDYTARLDAIRGANREIIEELGFWRDQLPASSLAADQTLAYLLEKIRVRHPSGWKPVSRRVVRKLTSEPTKLVARLALWVECFGVRDLAAMPDRTPGDDERLEMHRRGRAKYLLALQTGQRVVLTGVGEPWLPEWYFVAGLTKSTRPRDEWPDPDRD